MSGHLAGLASPGTCRDETWGYPDFGRFGLYERFGRLRAEMELDLGQVLLHRLEKAHDKKDRAHRKAGRARKGEDGFSSEIQELYPTLPETCLMIPLVEGL